MSNIQKEIKEALNLASQDFDKGAYVHASEKIEEYAFAWLLHQQELMEQKDAEIARLREQLGYLKLTPMQKMSRAMETISQFEKGANT